MKTILTLMTLLCLTLATPVKAQELDVKHLGGGSCLVRIQTQQKYLLLPVEEAMPDVRLSLIAGTQEVKNFTVRLAVNKVDYLVPLDLSVFRGRQVSLKFSVNHEAFRKAGISVMQTEFVKGLRLSDTFDTANREPFRPVYHFTPPYGWMNDPNGMVYKDGEYHLFYQHNPYGSRWGNMTWGHAVTRDLLHWQHLPLAIEGDALGAIFSGSAVVDADNTAGFGKGAIVAIYTEASDAQMQSIAYSTDNGRTFRKYENNPVLTADVPDFRDPKVFWHADTKHWIMALAVGQELRVYSSPNLKEWTLESTFGQDQGAHGGVWECPDLFELPVEGMKESKWVLLVNINPGGPFGGNATQYFVGTFDGHRFVNESPYVTKWMDFGKDHYATVTWSNAPKNRRIALAWMSNWQYANQVPTMQFRSANSVPRELSLFRVGKETYLKSAPVPELEKLRKGKAQKRSFDVKREYRIDRLLADNPGTYELQFSVKQKKQGVLGLRLQNGRGEEAVLRLDMKSHTLSFNRDKSGQVDFSDDFAVETSAQVDDGTLQLRLFVDKSSIEVFVNDGRYVLTNLVFPAEPYNQLTFFTEGDKVEVKDFSVYELGL